MCPSRRGREGDRRGPGSRRRRGVRRDHRHPGISCAASPRSSVTSHPARATPVEWGRSARRSCWRGSRRGAPSGPKEDEQALLEDLGQVLRDASICGLGQTANDAVRTGLRFCGAARRGARPPSRRRAPYTGVDPAIFTHGPARSPVVPAPPLPARRGPWSCHRRRAGERPAGRDDPRGLSRAGHRGAHPLLRRHPHAGGRVSDVRRGHRWSHARPVVLSRRSRRG